MVLLSYIPLIYDKSNEGREISTMHQTQTIIYVYEKYHGSFPSKNMKGYH